MTKNYTKANLEIGKEMIEKTMIQKGMIERKNEVQMIPEYGKIGINREKLEKSHVIEEAEKETSVKGTCYSEQNRCERFTFIVSQSHCI